MQRWRFLVIRDLQVKQTVGAYYEWAWDEVVAPRYGAGEPAPGTSPERFKRMLDAAQYLADHIHEAPVWIVPCLEGANPTRTLAPRFIRPFRTCCWRRERSAYGARSLDAHRPKGRPLTYRRDGSLLTHRWREPDSNHRSRREREGHGDRARG
jgi:hypothetical protein